MSKFYPRGMSGILREKALTLKKKMQLYSKRKMPQMTVADYILLAAGHLEEVDISPFTRQHIKEMLPKLNQSTVSVHIQSMTINTPGHGACGEKYRKKCFERVARGQYEFTPYGRKLLTEIKIQFVIEKEQKIFPRKPAPKKEHVIQDEERNDREEYNRVFLEAVEYVIEKYRMGNIRFYSEGDLQSHVFSECLRIMEIDSFRGPMKIYCERGVFSKRSKVDLVLGDDDVLVEFKLETDYPGVSKPVVFSTIKEAGGSGSVELDLEKIDDYANKGKHAHFVMLDEDGKHARKIDGEWKEMTVRGEERFWLQVYRKPKKA